MTETRLWGRLPNVGATAWGLGYTISAGVSLGRGYGMYLARLHGLAKHLGPLHNSTKGPGIRETGSRNLSWSCACKLEQQKYPNGPMQCLGCHEIHSYAKGQKLVNCWSHNSNPPQQNVGHRKGHKPGSQLSAEEAGCFALFVGTGGCLVHRIPVLP